MDKQELYDSMAHRKMKPKDFEPYDGNNGRINKCVSLMRAGKIRTGGVLLDVGGGIGDLGYMTRDLFESCITLDISEASLRAAQAKGSNTICCDVDRDGFSTPPRGTGTYRVKEETVDTVAALDFIEHIIDPEKFARECSRVLKENGEVFINTPNIRFWKHLYQLWFGGRFPHTSGDREVYHGGHLAFFTFGDLCEIFSSAGFVDFQQFNDEECFEAPPPMFSNPLNPKNQNEYIKLQMELGCPNLLFKAVKR